jgi:hypothetical protein
MQQNFWMRKNHKELLTLFKGAFFAGIQLLVTAGHSKDLIEGGLQNDHLGRVWMVAIVQEALIQRSLGGAELLQEGDMMGETWLEFLVMTEFMDPAQGEFDRERVELGSIKASQKRNHWIGRLGSIGSDGQCIFHIFSYCGSQALEL